MSLRQAQTWEKANFSDDFFDEVIFKKRIIWREKNSSEYSNFKKACTFRKFCLFIYSNGLSNLGGKSTFYEVVSIGKYLISSDGTSLFLRMEEKVKFKRNQKAFKLWLRRKRAEQDEVSMGEKRNIIAGSMRMSWASCRIIVQKLRDEIDWNIMHGFKFVFDECKICKRVYRIFLSLHCFSFLHLLVKF